jgi:ribonucleoside-diphosphate reductase alpha chain
VAGHEGYLIVGLYEDGTPGELFITMAKEGSTIGGLMDSLGTAISVALQYGVPVQSLVNKFAHQRFEPMGITTNNDIPFAKSLVDYIFRWLGIQFISGYREQNSPNRDTKGTTETAPKSVTEDTRWKQDASKRTTGATEDTGKIESPNSPVTPRDILEMSSDQGADSASTPDSGGTKESRPAGTVLDQLNANLMGDAPACDVCGSITVRNGTCYKCNNCGNSMGCS